MARKEPKESKKQAPVCNSEANSPKRWPDLPQKLINIMATESILLHGICYKGVTKSWLAIPNKCNSSNSNPPGLHVQSDDSEKQPLTFNIKIERRDSESLYNYKYRRSWWRHQYHRLHFLGCSDGLPVADLNYGRLVNPFDDKGVTGWSLPPWDSSDPCLCAFLSSPPNNSATKYTLIVLTGITHPAFLFCKVLHQPSAFTRIAKGKERGWIKEDCDIVDPHHPNSSNHYRMRFTNGIWFNEKFYALSSQGTLAVIEDIDSHLRITALGKKQAVPSVSSMHFRECLVESGGEILLVFLISKKSSDVVDDAEVYSLNTAKLEWIKIDTLGNRTLFLSSNCCISFSASRVECRRDCIYFTNRSNDGWWVYDMKRGLIAPSWANSSSSIYNISSLD